MGFFVLYLYCDVSLDVLHDVIGYEQVILRAASYYWDHYAETQVSPGKTGKVLLFAVYGYQEIEGIHDF